MLVLESSIDVDVSPAFAWKFRTDISTWSDPTATCLLDGPFAEGSQGKTLIPGQAPLSWSIRDVQQDRSFAVEMALDRATIRFEWLFGVNTGGTTKLTQRILLSGSNVAAYRDQVQKGFESTLGDGMKRIAAEMVAADRKAKMAGERSNGE